jgi:hypothetical protein
MTTYGSKELLRRKLLEGVQEPQVNQEVDCTVEKEESAIRGTDTIYMYNLGLQFPAKANRHRVKLTNWRSPYGRTNAEQVTWQGTQPITTAGPAYKQTLKEEEGGIVMGWALSVQDYVQDLHT